MGNKINNETFYIYMNSNNILEFKHIRKVNGTEYNLIHNDLKNKNDVDAYIRKLIRNFMLYRSDIKGVEISQGKTDFEQYDFGNLKISLNNLDKLMKSPVFYGFEEERKKILKRKEINGRPFITNCDVYFDEAGVPVFKANQKPLVLKEKNSFLKRLGAAAAVATVGASIGFGVTNSLNDIENNKNAEKEANEAKSANSNEPNVDDEIARLAANSSKVAEREQTEQPVTAVEEQNVNEDSTKTEVGPITEDNSVVTSPTPPVIDDEPIAKEDLITINEEPQITDQEIEQFVESPYANETLAQTIEKDDLANFIRNAYGMSSDQLAYLIETNSDTLNNSDNYYLSLMKIAKQEFKVNEAAYNPVVGPINRETVQQALITAANIYGYANDDYLSSVLAITKLETGDYTSSLCKRCCNFGGIATGYSNGVYTWKAFETLEMGALEEISTIDYNVYLSKQNGNYREGDIIGSIGPSYCPESLPGLGDGSNKWVAANKNYKAQILNDGTIYNYQTEFNTPLVERSRIR